MRLRMLLLPFVAASVFSVAAFAQSEEPLKQPDQPSKLFLVLESRGLDEKSVRSLAFAYQLKEWQELFRTDRLAALERAGMSTGTPGTHYGQYSHLAVTEEGFMRAAAPRIQSRIDGYNLGSSAGGQTLAILAGLGAAYLSGGSSLAVTILAPAAAEKGTGALLNQIEHKGILPSGFDGIDLPKLTTDIQTWTTEDKLYGELVNSYLKSHLDLDLGTIDKHPAVTSSLLKKEFELMKTDQAAFERAVTEKLERAATLRQEDSALVQQIKKETSAQQMLSLYKDRQAIQDEQDKIAYSFGALRSLGSIMRFSPEQMRMVDASAQITAGLARTSHSSFAQDPAMFTNVYLMMAAFALDLLRDAKASPSPWEGIFTALNALSRQIDDLHTDMLVQFRNLNIEVDQRFTRLGSVLNAIRAAQRGQTEELLLMSAQIKALRSDYGDMTRTLASRIEDVARLDCLSLKAPPDDAPAVEVRTFEEKFKSCLNQAVLLAASWSKDSLSVEQADVSPADKDETPRNFAKNLGRWFPYLGRLRFGEGTSAIPNPQVWKSGVHLYTAMLIRHPRYAYLIELSGLQQMRDAGIQLQSFFSRSVTSEFGFDYQFYRRLLTQFQDAADKYLVELNKRDLYDLPLKGSEQALPEEIIGGEQKAKAEEVDEGPPGMWNFVTATKHIRSRNHRTELLADRGNFSPAADSIYGIVKTQLVMCTDSKAEYLPTALPSVGNPSVGQVQAIGNPEGAIMNLNRGILPFVPRPALWYERLSNGTVRTTACLEWHTVNEGGAVFRIAYSSIIRIAVVVTLKGKMTAPIVVARAHFFDYTPQFRVICGQTRLGNPNHLRVVWNGGGYCGVQYPGIAMDLRGSLTLLPPTPETEGNIAAINKVLRDEVMAEKLRSFDPEKVPGDEAKSYRTLEMAYFMLLLFPAFSDGQLPDLGTVFDVVASPNFMVPKQILGAVLSGEEPKDVASRVEKQVNDLNSVAERAGRMLLHRKVRTSVDDELALLDLIAQRQKAANN